MPLALFDLDNTLLAGDSDYLWGQHLVEMGAVDKGLYEHQNRKFYGDYRLGRLDIYEFLAFALQPLTQYPMDQLKEWRQAFISEKIAPIILPQGQQLIQSHRDQGNFPVIISATNGFITQPIAQLFGVDDLIATELEVINGQFTGQVSGTACFREGKIERLEHWLKAHDMTLTNSAFYSDSRNDIPLLDRVTYPIATDPDPELRSHAKAHNWQIISLRG